MRCSAKKIYIYPAKLCIGSCFIFYGFFFFKMVLRKTFVFLLRLYCILSKNFCLQMVQQTRWLLILRIELSTPTSGLGRIHRLHLSWGVRPLSTRSVLNMALNNLMMPWFGECGVPLHYVCANKWLIIGK